MIVRQKLHTAMTRVELVAALQNVQKQLLRSPSWKKLGKTAREALLNKVIEDLDGDEESMRV